LASWSTRAACPTWRAPGAPIASLSKTLDNWRVSRMQEMWTLREVARVARRSPQHAVNWARAGMLPGYSEANRGERLPAKVPAATATAYAHVLAVGACSPQLAELMKAEPEKVLAVAEALALLARTAIESTSATNGRAA
jgi:hypothetical protein